MKLKSAPELKAQGLEKTFGLIKTSILRGSCPPSWCSSPSPKLLPQFDLCLFQFLSPAGRQIFTSPVDVETEH
jgi:hypothetical protein